MDISEWDRINMTYRQSYPDIRKQDLNFNMYCPKVLPRGTAPSLQTDIHSHMTLYYIYLSGYPWTYKIDSDREDIIRIEKD